MSESPVNPVTQPVGEPAPVTQDEPVMHSTQGPPTDPNNELSSESSESSSSAEESPVLADPVPVDGSSSESSSEPSPEPTALDVLRSFISAIVACINTHCNSTGSDEAATRITALKDQADGILSGPEVSHLDKVFSHIAKDPAPINAFPEAPAADAPVEDEPESSSAPYPGIHTGA